MSTAARMMELEVEDASFMLDTLGQDCEPLQFLRELTENGIQAIQATPEGSGEVIWDVDWISFEADGLLKLSCTDTGIGMSGDDLKRYINHLSASRHRQSIHGNRGVGAKIAAAPRNPHGIIYLSWTSEDTGSSTQLYRDAATGRWGLAQFRLRDGSWDHVFEPEVEVRPGLIALSGHGTKVVLLGRSREDNTMEPPEGIENRTKWISRYLNQRYFRFPDGITVKAREGWEVPRSHSDINKMRRIRGQEHYLERHSVDSGSLQLEDATAHWWILADETEKTRRKDAIWASTGHRAALYQDELYELITPSRGGYQKVQEFGIRFAYSRVVIYVEPDLSGGRTTSSTSRAELKVEGSPLPWARWAEEFAGNLPAAIRELEEQTASSTVDEDFERSLRERLRPLLDIYKDTRYRPKPGGRRSISDPEIGGESVRGQDSTDDESESGTEGGTSGNIYSLFQADHGRAGEAVEAELWPRIDWVSAHHDPPTRTPPHLEDRAARYDRRTNWLEINEDFRVFQSTMRRWRERYQDVPGAGSIIESEVKAWFAQQLVEAVLGAQTLRRSREWDDQAIDRLLSPEALTAVVQPRYFIEERLKRDLANKLGRLVAAAA